MAFLNATTFNSRTSLTFVADLDAKDATEEQWEVVAPQDKSDSP